MNRIATAIVGITFAIGPVGMGASPAQAQQLDEVTITFPAIPCPTCQGNGYTGRAGMQKSRAYKQLEDSHDYALPCTACGGVRGRRMGSGMQPNQVRFLAPRGTHQPSPNQTVRPVR